MRTTVDLTVQQPRIAVDILSEATGLPKDAMAKSACWWMPKGKQVKAGTRLQLHYDDTVLVRKPETLEDKNRYSVWFKPQGLLAQGSQLGDHAAN